MHAMCPNFFNIPLLTKIRSTLFIHFRNYWYSNKRSNYFEFIYAIISGASPGFGRGGGQEFFFSRFGNLHVAKRHAAHGEAMCFARGVRGHAPPRNFFKMRQFGAF